MPKSIIYPRKCFSKSGKRIKPMVLVLTGSNGSGKSTITQYFEKVGEYTNADDVVIATGMDNFEAA